MLPTSTIPGPWVSTVALPLPVPWTSNPTGFRCSQRRVDPLTLGQGSNNDSETARWALPRGAGGGIRLHGSDSNNISFTHSAKNVVGLWPMYIFSRIQLQYLGIHLCITINCNTYLCKSRIVQQENSN